MNTKYIVIFFEFVFLPEDCLNNNNKDMEIQDMWKN